MNRTTGRLARFQMTGLKKAKLQLGFGFLLFFAPSLVFAQFDSKRQQERKSTRWTLSDWLDTKKQISAQNSWLSTHVNKVPVDGAFHVTQSPERLGGAFEFYMKWLGMRAAYEHPTTYMLQGATPDLGGSRSQIDLQLRLFGNNIQDTNIVVRGGAGFDQVRDVPGFNGDYLGWSVEPEVQIYFAKFLGVWGSWRYRFAHQPVENRDLAFRGTSWKSAAFIEMNALRIEVGYQSRNWNFKNSDGGAGLDLQSESLFGGLRLFY
jgi:hypothetical protein